MPFREPLLEMHSRSGLGVFDASDSACTFALLVLCAGVGLSVLQAWRCDSNLLLCPSAWSALLGLLLLAASLLALGASAWRAVVRGRWLGAPRSQGALASALALVLVAAFALLLRASLC